MQARASVAGQASISGNDALSSVLPCWGTRCAKAKEEMLSACALQFGCVVNFANWMHLRVKQTMWQCWAICSCCLLWLLV